MITLESLIAAGMCICACGQPAPISDRNRPALGVVRGQPGRLVLGHSSSPFRLDRPKWEVDEATGCWLWTSTLNDDGYGTTAPNPEKFAHRGVYHRLLGPVPEGMELDHLCRVRRCVNPDHLEPVAQAKNKGRAHGWKFGPTGEALTCGRGHDLTTSGAFYVPPGDSARRECRACRNSWRLRRAA